MPRRPIETLAIAMAVVILLLAARNRASRPPETPAILSATRSFEITDKSIVASFTLDRVLTQLIERSGVNGLTPDQLIRRMFDTQTPQSGALDPDGPHCDDTLTNGAPSFNGFPRRCPTPRRLRYHSHVASARRMRRSRPRVRWTAEPLLAETNAAVAA